MQRKYIWLLFLLTLLLPSCGSFTSFSPTLTPSLTETLTETPTATATPTPTRTESHPTATDTPRPTETPSLPDIWGLAPSLDQFPAGKKEDISNYIAYLRSHPSLLTPGSLAPDISQIVSSSSGEAHFVVNCNMEGVVNCAPAATFQFSEQINGQTIDVHIIIWEMRNRDGSRGYLVEYNYDHSQFRGPKEYPRIVSNPSRPKEFIVDVGVARSVQGEYSYMMSLFQQPGFMKTMQQWIDTGNIPEEMYDLIVP
jgi:hypothetical protein